MDRSSRPLRMRGKMSRRKITKMIELRRTRLTAAQISNLVGCSRATVARVLAGAGLSRLRSLDPVPPPRRYERAFPGEMLHLDIKRLGRIKGVGHRITGIRKPKKAGWECLHVCIDDASRIAYAEILPNQRKEDAMAFLRRSVAWFRDRQIDVQRIMTDNGGCYIAPSFGELCHDLRLRHVRTRPYTPRTNGKAERFIQTLLREWAYRFRYSSSRQRCDILKPYLHFYNHHRGHTSLGRQPPVSRLPMNNLLRLDNY